MSTEDDITRSETAQGMRMMAIELEKSAVALEHTARDLRNRARIARNAAERYDGDHRG